MGFSRQEYWSGLPFPSPTAGREHSSTHKQKIGLKIYWAWHHPSEQDPVPLQSVSPIRKLPQACYPSPSEGRQTENHHHSKLTNLISWTTALSTQWNYEPCRVGPPKMDWTWWRDLTKCGTLEKAMIDHFSIPALRTPWTVWKGKKIGHWKWTPQVSGCPICY